MGRACHARRTDSDCIDRRTAGHHSQAGRLIYMSQRTCQRLGCRGGPAWKTDGTQADCQASDRPLATDLEISRRSVWGHIVCPIVCPFKGQTRIVCPLGGHIVCPLRGHIARWCWWERASLSLPLSHSTALTPGPLASNLKTEASHWHCLTGRFWPFLQSLRRP